MNNRLIVLILSFACLTACSSTQPAATQTPPPAAQTNATPGQTPAAAAAPAVPANNAAVSNLNDAIANKLTDAFAIKLRELAGNDATDCGRIKALAGPELNTASDCAMKAARAKHGFTVAYDMPGLTVGVAGNAQGKLVTLSAQSDKSGAVAAANIKTEPCAAELRVANSGRVTCYPPGSMGMGSSGANPHGGTMPLPAPGTPNPHGTMPPPGHPKVSPKT